MRTVRIQIPSSGTAQLGNPNAAPATAAAPSLIVPCRRAAPTGVALAGWVAAGWADTGLGVAPCRGGGLEGVEDEAEEFGGFDGFEGYGAFVGEEFVAAFGAVLFAACGDLS